MEIKEQMGIGFCQVDLTNFFITIIIRTKKWLDYGYRLGTS